MKKAICTIATGVYFDLWDTYSRPSLQAFCDRNNYELIVFSEPLDPSTRAANRSIAWQKLICHEHPRLIGIDYLIWLDADVVVNPLSPDPLDQSDPRK